MRKYDLFKYDLLICLVWLMATPVVSTAYAAIETPAALRATSTDTTDRAIRLVARVSDPQPRGNPLWAVPLTALSATAARPLFSASRRPPAPAPIAAEAALPPPAPPPAPSLPQRPMLALIGTALGPTVQIGIFRDETTGKIIRLPTGGLDQGWTLRTVSPRDARFEMADKTAILPLHPAIQPSVQGKVAPQTAGLLKPERRREWYDN